MSDLGQAQHLARGRQIEAAHQVHPIREIRCRPGARHITGLAGIARERPAREAHAGGADLFA
jgi:hypothetical protein